MTNVGGHNKKLYIRAHYPTNVVVKADIKYNAVAK